MIKKNQVMKRYADSKRYVKDHKVQIGDFVLVPQRKRNKFTTPYRNMKYVVIKTKGAMITARNEFGQTMTRDASKMKKINDCKVCELDTEDDEIVKEKSHDQWEGAETGRKEVQQSRRDEECRPLRRSNRIRKATKDTRYRDYMI